MYRKYLMTAAVALIAAAACPVFAYAGEDIPIEEAEELQAIEEEEKIPVADEDGSVEDLENEEKEPVADDGDEKEDEKEGEGEDKEESVLKSFEVSPGSAQTAFGTEQTFSFSMETKDGVQDQELALHVPEGMEVIKADPEGEDGYVFTAGGEETEGGSYEGSFKGGELVIKKKDGSAFSSVSVTVKAVGTGKAVLGADLKAGGEEKHAEAELSINADISQPSLSFEDKDKTSKTVTIKDVSIEGLEDGAQGRITIKVPKGISIKDLNVPEMDGRTSFVQDGEEIVIDLEAADGKAGLGGEKITMTASYEGDETGSFGLDVKVSAVKDGEELTSETETLVLAFEGKQEGPVTEPEDPDKPDDPDTPDTPDTPTDPQPQPQQPEEPDRPVDDTPSRGQESAPEPIDSLAPRNENLPVSPVNPVVEKTKPAQPRVVDYTGSNRVAGTDASNILSTGANRSSTKSASAMTDRLRDAMARASRDTASDSQGSVEDGIPGESSGTGAVPGIPAPAGEGAGRGTAAPGTDIGDAMGEGPVEGRTPPEELQGFPGSYTGSESATGQVTGQAPGQASVKKPAKNDDGVFVFILAGAVALIGIVSAAAYFILKKKDGGQEEDKGDKTEDV